MCPGEVQVTLVMGGNTHDRPGPVVGQDVVGRPDRNALTVDRVDRVPPQEDARLGPVGRLPLDVGQLAYLGQVLGQCLTLLRCADLLRQRRVGGDDEERRAVQRVGAGGEHGHRLVPSLDREPDLGTLGAADPVPLHQQHPVGPVALQRRHVRQQPVGVLGDLEIPLRQQPPDHFGAAPFAMAADHLLVGQDGLVDRAPVDIAVFAVGQSPLVEAQEQPLVPAVILRVGRVQPPRPVERHRIAAERGRLRLDVGVCPVGRVGVIADGCVLGGQPERVPADGVQHVVTAVEVIPRYRVRDRVRLRVTHVQVARGVGEHVQEIGPRPGVGRVVARPEQVHPGPPRQPFLLDLARVIVLLCPLGTVGGCHDLPSPCDRSGSGNRKAPRSRGAAAPTGDSVGAAR